MSKNKVNRCDKAGCKSVDVHIHAFGIGDRVVRLCDDCDIAWANDNDARRCAQEESFCRVAVEAHVSAGRAESAQAAARTLFAQHDVSRAYVDKWLRTPMGPVGV